MIVSINKLAISVYVCIILVIIINFFKLKIGKNEKIIEKK